VPERRRLVLPTALLIFVGMIAAIGAVLFFAISR
jgi:hypothetical protein